MKTVINFFLAIVIVTLVGCSDKGERAFYQAANKPMVDITLPAPGGGEYRITTRRPDLDQYENQWVRGIKAVGGVISTPAGTIVAVGAAVLGNTKGDTVDSNNQTTTTTNITELLEEEEVEE